MSDHRRILVSVTIAAVGAFATVGAAHAQDAPAQVERTARTIRSEGSGIMKFVYPSVALTSVGGCSWSSARDGFELNCPFFYKDDGDPGFRRIVFHLNPAGLITGIADGGGNAVWPPFATARLTTALIADAARDNLRQNPGMDRDTAAILGLLAQSPEPQDILALLLDIEIARQS